MQALRNIAAVLLLLFASACVTNGGYGPNQGIGTIVGAGLGGLAGNQFGRGDGKVIMTVLGVLGGGWIGNELGRNADMQQQPVYAAPHSYPHQGVIMSPSPVYVQQQPVIIVHGGYGYARCDALGEISQARADCVRAIADQRARQDAWETQNQRQRRY